MATSERNMVDVNKLLLEGGVRLEITGGVPTWEAFPGFRHQHTVMRILLSIVALRQSDSGCDCFSYPDVDIHFPDGSFKRPDISIFCYEPPMQDGSLTVLPSAAIEIISPDYEYKDRVLNPPFYLSQGVMDVVIVEPRTGEVWHYRQDGMVEHKAPVTLELQCGCRCAVPEPC